MQCSLICSSFSLGKRKWKTNLSPRAFWFTYADTCICMLCTRDGDILELRKKPKPVITNSLWAQSHLCCFMWNTSWGVTAEQCMSLHTSLVAFSSTHYFFLQWPGEVMNLGVKKWKPGRWLLQVGVMGMAEWLCSEGFKVISTDWTKHLCELDPVAQLTGLKWMSWRCTSPQRI